MRHIFKKLASKINQQHTGCTLNYLTLQVRDDKINQSITKFQEDHLIRCRFFVLAFAFISLIINLCMIKTNHPMMLVSSAVVLVWAIVGNIQVQLGERKRLKYNIFLFTMIHVTCSTLVYQEWLPEILQGKKNVFELQILYNYMAINILSNQHFLLGFCTQGPIMIVGSYL